MLNVLNEWLLYSIGYCRLRLATQPTVFSGLFLYMKRTWYYRLSSIYNTSDFCSYCWVELEPWEKVIDHFYPVSWWWWNSKHNLFVSCRECNAIKSNFIFDTLSEARNYILPKKKIRKVVDDHMNVLEDEDAYEPDEIHHSPYLELKVLQKYHNCVYVHWIWNIDFKRRDLIKKYLLYKFVPLLDDSVLSEILTESKRKILIVYRNKSLC